MSKSITINNLDEWFKDLAFVVQQNNAPFASIEAIQEFTVDYALRHKWGTVRCAHVLVVAKEMGLVEDDVWHEHKEVMSKGAAWNLRMTMAIAKAEKELTNGRLIKYPKYVGVVTEKKPKKDKGEIENTSPYPDNPFYVQAKSEIGIARAKKYLKVDVIGHIRNKLAILAANDEDVSKVVKELKADITKLVKREFT